jgi:trans-2,3-dihydro-3-hydroxyanthranilate isomerase
VPLYDFETVDVFTDRRFGGNPLAVFTDARGLSSDDMQSLAAELNLSETTFVLPPEDATNTAKVRIFNRTAEMPFAGHPTIGTGYVLAKRGQGRDGLLTLEVPAGLARVAIERNSDGMPVGGAVSAPQPLTIGESVSAEVIAACIGIGVQDVLVSAHQPLVASVGNPYVIAQITEEALKRCLPDLAAFRKAQEAHPSMGGRFSLHVYAGQGNRLRARMFAPLAGTWEDPATGSANAPLGALLLSLSSAESAEFEIRQGEEMGRPSLLIVTAHRGTDGIRATVAGRCVPVLAGHASVRA